LLIDNTATVHPPGPQNPRECHLYFAEGCHLYMALTGMYQKFGVVEDYWKATGSDPIEKGRFDVTKKSR
jgi:hypothetical protein